MNAALGTAGVALGLAAAVIGAITIVVGLVGNRPALLRSSRLYVGLLIVGALLHVLRDGAGADHSRLLARSTSRATAATRHPPLYNFAALWSALEGSIILWSLILTGYIAVVVHHFRKRLTDPLVGWAIAVMLVVAAFFFLLMLGPANPFKTVQGAIPTDGPGPNPLLQNHILMAFHPPMLYLGYVGFTVPFAFAIAALITGRVGEGWLIETRRWTLFAWGFLTVGIVLGAWWSYEVLGWGGYWAWDPVENASFLPWLTGTAYLHSVMVQERRGMLRGLEPVAAVRHVLAHDPRHVPHAVGRARLGARVLGEPDRGVHPHVLRDRRPRIDRAHRVAGRSSAVARLDRLARSRVRARSSPTTCCSPRSRSSCCSAPCSR